MTWTDNLADLQDAIFDPEGFGEPVTLPDARVVNGIFDLRGSDPISLWPDAGASMKLSDQPNPVL